MRCRRMLYPRPNSIFAALKGFNSAATDSQQAGPGSASLLPTPAFIQSAFIKSLPLGLALLEKCGQSFSRGVGGSRRCAVGCSGGEQRGQVLADRLVEQALGQLNGFRSAFGDLSGRFLCSRPDQVGFNDLMKQSDAMGLGRLDR